MIHNKNIQKCNRKLREAFGYSPSGLSRYAWKKAGELLYLLKTGTANATVPPFSGKGKCPHCGGEGSHEHKVSVIVPTYNVRSWQDRLGAVWTIGKWDTAQLNEQQWFYAFGSRFPYPHQGRYIPITSCTLLPGDTPDEDITDFLIAAIRTQLETTELEMLDYANRLAEEPQIERKKAWEDFVDDTSTTYDQVPGEKGHVSYPAVTLK